MDKDYMLSHMKKYSYEDNVFSFEGAVSVYKGKGYSMPFRIDCSHIDFFPVLNELKAKQASGVRLSFNTDSKNIIINVINDEEDLMLDLFIDNSFYKGITASHHKGCIEFLDLPEGLKKIDIWLDQRREFKLCNLMVDEDCNIYKVQSNQKRWIHYGSSISHSLEGESPSKTWAAMVAQRLDLHLTNLGFHSECKCDPMIGFVIREIPADYITLKVGINLVDGDLNTRTFKPAILGLINIIRDKKPDTPIVLCSPIYTPLYDDIKGGSGYNLKEMREVVLECVHIFREYGDKNIFYTDGLKLFGPQYIQHMPDDLHPNAEGQYIMANNFINEVFKSHLL